MKYLAIAVRDSAMNAFMRPMFVQAVGQATRSFGDEVNRKAEDNPMYGHSEDYELYVLGSYDEDTGRLESLSEPQLIVRGKDVKQQ